ncbi:hypothetical protein [uncultured Shimia sp.]|nr:hypothetical protein [uncultured Shimia sp.]
MRIAFLFLILTGLVACQTTGTPTARPGYSASGMCNGGAHCGNGR